MYLYPGRVDYLSIQDFYLFYVECKTFFNYGINRGGENGRLAAAICLFWLYVYEVMRLAF